MNRHSRLVAAAAILVAISCNVYDPSLLVGPSTGLGTGGTSVSKGGTSGKSGASASGGDSGTSPALGGTGGGGTAGAASGAGGMAGRGGTAGRAGGGASSGGATQGGSGGSGGTDTLGGAGGEGGEAGMNGGAPSSGTGGTGGGGMGGAGTGGKGGGGTGGKGGSGGGGAGGAGAGGKGGSGGAGAGGTGGAGAGGTGGSGTVGCAKLSVPLDDNQDKAHFVISIASPYANMSATGTTISLRLYIQAGSGGSIFPYVQDSGTFHFLNPANSTFTPLSGTGTWKTVTWDVAAEPVGTTQIVKTSIQRIGIEIGVTPTTAGPWANPTVVYIDSVSVNTATPLSFPFDTTATVNPTGTTSDPSNTALWLNTGTSDTKAANVTLTWVATCP